ncbi:hypothetical protein BKA64DRAFT_648177 [Cadophora sp. MPI-SDFR-AT-0126]|nr:hypothetical protein BKA64DRAFT_648177 [Leotiomycetes sp. MPI-SDFR-AT-0126]
MARLLLKALAFFSPNSPVTAFPNVTVLPNITGPYPCPYGGSLWCCPRIIYRKEPYASILARRFNVELQHTDYVGRNCWPMPFILQGQNTCTKLLACCEGPRSLPAENKSGRMRANTGTMMGGRAMKGWLHVGYGYGFGYGLF